MIIPNFLISSCSTEIAFYQVSPKNWRKNYSGLQKFGSPEAAQIVLFNLILIASLFCSKLLQYISNIYSYLNVTHLIFTITRTAILISYLKKLRLRTTNSVSHATFLNDIPRVESKFDFKVI